ncbi:uncharacterized protein LOC144744965 [Ciona intestinalis]
MMKRSIRKTDGRYEMGLPWKSESIALPYNRCLAEKRLGYLKRKLNGDPDLLKRYAEKMEESIRCGHIEKVNHADRVSGSRIWYVTHHCTGPKFRVVFDCAA